MHHSRLTTLMIDCLDENFAAALKFWPQALGFKPPRKPRAGQRYITLGELQGPLYVRLQRVDKNPGFHLDIETDYRRKETERLQAAGAKSKYRIKSWLVMEDPSGNPFCLVRPESEQFPDHANAWD